MTAPLLLYLLEHRPSENPEENFKLVPEKDAYIYPRCARLNAILDFTESIKP